MVTINSFGSAGAAAVAVLGLAGAVVGDVSGPAVAINDHATMGLKAYHNFALNEFLNSGGHVSVKRGTTVSLGTSLFTGATIFGTWDEIAGGSTTRVQVSYWTADGSPIVPPGSRLSGNLVQFIGWEFGIVDPVDFGAWVDSVDIASATAFATGPNDFYDEINITSTILSPWDGRGGNATQSTLAWAEATQIGLEFEYFVAPAPAAAGVFITTAGLLLGRRRRD